MASIYKRKGKDGKISGWRVVIRIKGFPTTCKTFDRKQQAEDWAHETEQRIKLGQFNFSSHKLQHTYDELAKRQQSDGVFEHHRSFEKIRSQFEYWQKRLGHYALSHITPELIGKERQILIDTPSAKGTKRAAGTINRYLAVLSSTLNYAVQRLRWLESNPCSHIQKLKDKAVRDRTVQKDEFARLIDACRVSKSPYLFCIFLIAITTGARRGEILGLEWKHVDFENKLAHFKETKNGSPRSVALTDSVVAELKSLYEQCLPNKPLVFASNTAFGKVDIKKGWQEALKRAGITGLRFHDLRHSFATMAARKGASNLELATAMGHRTLQMLQRYTHLEAESTRRYSEAIDQVVGGKHEESPYRG